MSFGEKFKILVDKSGQSYEKIADALGLKSRSSVSHYMKSDSPPKHDMFIKMCDFFGVSPSYFDEGSGEFDQPKTEYDLSEYKVPVFDSESVNAEKVAFMILPNICEGFAIAIYDDRLKSMGIGRGDTVILTKKFSLGDRHRIIAERNGERFFATYEKISGSKARIIPADPELLPVMLGEEKSDTTVYAVVKSVLCNE